MDRRINELKNKVKEEVFRIIKENKETEIKGAEEIRKTVNKIKKEDATPPDSVKRYIKLIGEAIMEINPEAHHVTAEYRKAFTSNGHLPVGFEVVFVLTNKNDDEVDYARCENINGKCKYELFVDKNDTDSRHIEYDLEQLCGIKLEEINEDDYDDDFYLSKPHIEIFN